MNNIRSLALKASDSSMLLFVAATKTLMKGAASSSRCADRVFRKRPVINYVKTKTRDDVII